MRNSPSPSDSRRRWIVISFCALVVIGTCELFAPLVDAAVWHVRQGFSLVVLGYQIPVPWRWTAEVTFNNGGISIVKPPLSFEISKSPQAHISIFPSEANTSPANVTATEDSELGRWIDGVQRVMARGTLPSTTQRKDLGEGVRHVVCLETKFEAYPNQLQSSCYLTASRWRAMTVGKPSDIEVFYRILLSVKKLS